MQTPFVEPTGLNDSQLFFMTIVYAVVLYQASNLISGGSELLMLVPAVAGIVGSIVLPILGAVPDGMMVLFSGVGPNAQETVSVGVGALAGSTVMLLTFPWFICILYGGVPLVDGQADYKLKGESAGTCNSGIKYQGSIKKGAAIMLATTVLYLIIQVPASVAEEGGLDTKHQAKHEHKPALWGLIACILAFFGYLVYCFNDAQEDKQLEKIIKGIKKKQVNLLGVMGFFQTRIGTGKDQALLDDENFKKLKKVVKPLFKSYDMDESGCLSMNELQHLFKDLGFAGNQRMKKEMMAELDPNNDNKVTFDEFAAYLDTFIKDPTKLQNAIAQSNSHLGIETKSEPAAEEDEDEDVEIPEDLEGMSPEKQRIRIIWRALWMMGVGTGLVLVFSDPMVDALSEWGNRLGISPFYVSFILAPFASNASELLSAYTYAIKKSEKSITTSLSTLIGASCMNNTFVLAIFLALIYLQGLAWQFTAETIAMVLIQWVIGLLAITSKTQTFTTGIIILLCYPGCLFIVWFLENHMGLD